MKRFAIGLLFITMLAGCGPDAPDTNPSAATKELAPAKLARCSQLADFAKLASLRSLSQGLPDQLEQADKALRAMHLTEADIKVMEEAIQYAYMDNTLRDTADSPGVVESKYFDACDDTLMKGGGEEAIASPLLYVKQADGTFSTPPAN
jgi:hypothetical protein